MNSSSHLVVSPSIFVTTRLARCAALLLLALLVFLPVAHAQTTATITGTVLDTSSAVIPNAQVTLTNEASNDVRVVASNGDGNFVFPSLIPGSYTITVELKGFKTSKQIGVVVHAGDNIKVPNFALEVGDSNTSVTVVENTQIIPVDNGERAAVLDSQDIENLALETRNVSELLKVLPGVTVAPSATGNSGVGAALLAVSTGQSAVGNNISFNGVPNRGGTSQLADGVDINDPGCNCNAIATINPDMTQEVTVQTSNFGADVSHGPVIVNTISKSGGADYHGEGYFFARNDALNANDWQSDHQGIAKGDASYYYPGGNIGGPIPFTHKKLLGWFGYEHYLQNQGNANVLHSYIPSPGMAAGNFTSAGQGNAALCPSGFSNTATNWCNNLDGFGLSNGAIIGHTAGYPDGIIPTAFLDPGAAALAKVWPAANADPATTPGGYNYYEPIDNIHNGYTYRARVDYNYSDKTKFYFSFQYGNDSSLVQGNGAHIYWTPGDAIPFPGGGLSTLSTTKSVAGHFVHIFNSTTTNELIATWGYGNFPVGPSDISQVYKTTLGYPYPSIFGGSKIIPAYGAPGGGYGSDAYPDFSQQDIFEPTGKYTVRKEVPQFEDDFTKVWGTHTIKIGAFTENVSNLQGSFSNINGNLDFEGGGAPDVLTGTLIGGQNPTANFFTGTATSYTEQNGAPVESLAFQTISFYVNDSWKATRRLTIEVGARFEHISHWYDRNGVGNAVWLPGLVASDFAAGQPNPGIRYHAIDPGIPTTGSPNRLAFVSPRFGMAYDVFGDGRTVVRGGIGTYRFNDQTNDYDAALTTALGVGNYSVPGGHNVLLSEIGPGLLKTGQSSQGSVNAVPYNDYDVPVTYAWNMTVSQQLPWHSLLEVAYVGNNADELFMGGETISGSGYASFTDQNKTPLGAFFAPDPVTGIIAPSPENISASTGGVNQAADYHPYGKYYGTNQILVNSHVGYSNYNAMQLSWVKRSDRLTFNANFTWSKTLGTGQQINPFNVHANYGVAAIDRPYVVNTSADYNLLKVYHGENKIVGAAANGWTISQITSWQSGGNLQAINSPNFGLALNYDPTTLPAATTPSPGFPFGYGSNTGISQASYFGTDATMLIMPITTCNPNSNLGGSTTIGGQKYFGQRVNGSCFTAPPIGTQGPRTYGYPAAASFFDSDLALYKTFHINDRNSIQFRVSAFNWLNHPLPEFSSGNQITLKETANFQNPGAGFTVSPSQTGTFGYLDTKAGAPNQRIWELSLKYMF
jgi:hypothetical protein